MFRILIVFVADWVAVAMDLLHFAGKTLEVGANAVTDNPLVIVEEGALFLVGIFTLGQLPR